MNDRYVIANVRLPLRVHLDGSTKPLPEYMTLTIEKCDQLPTDPPANNASAEFASQLQAILNLYNTNTPLSATLPPPSPDDHTVQEEVPFKMTVTQNELHNRPVKSTLHNTSFKSQRHNYHRHTAKRSPNS